MPLSGKLPTGSLPISRPFLPLIHNGPYPRSGNWLLFRRIFLFCRSIVGLYAANALTNLILAMITKPLSLLSINALFAVVVLPAFIVQPNASPWIYGTSAALFVFVLLGGVWATRDKKREAKMMHARETHQIFEEELRERGLDKQLPKPQGPPFDLNSLPHPGPGKLVGRMGDKEWLLKQLRMSKSNRVVALYGLGGIGKTALAAEVLHKLYTERRFKDGIAVIRCQGMKSVEEVLVRVLTRFDPHRRSPKSTDLNGLEKDIDRLLKGKSALVVLDNVEPALPIKDVVTHLFSAGTIAILLTARQALPQSMVPWEASRRLTELSAKEALDLLAQYLGKPVNTMKSAERSAAESIVDKLGYHTLAIKIVGVYAASSRRDLEKLEQELDNLQKVIKLDDDEEAPGAVKLAFEKSTELLPVEARNLFVALAAFPTIEFSREAALALANHLDAEKAERSVDLLVSRGLLDASTIENMPPNSDRERRRLHPLMRAFAEDSFNQWTERERFAANHTVVTFYANYSIRTVEKVLGYDEANITGALKWAYEQQQDELVTQLCEGMQFFWLHRSRMKVSLDYLPKGIHAIAQHTNSDNDCFRLATLQQTYGQILQKVGQTEEARKNFDEALTLFKQTPDQQGEYEILASLGEIAQQRGDPEEAERYYRRSLTILREMQEQLNHQDKQEGAKILLLYRQSEGEILTSIGEIAQQRGLLREAEGYYEQSVNILQETVSPESQIYNLIHLGEIAQYRGQKTVSEKYYGDALLITKNIQDRQGEGWVLAHLGDLALSFNLPEEAGKHCQKALDIVREVQYRRGECWVLSCMGRLEQHRGMLEKAEAYYMDALEMAQEVQDKREESKANFHLGQIAQRRKQLGKAEEYYGKALTIADDMHDAFIYAEVALKLGTLLVEQQRHTAEGCARVREAVQIYASMKVPHEGTARRICQSIGCGK